jgi:phosphoserine phosphatase
MAPQTIICDWNGTLIGHRNEMPLFSFVGNGLFKASLPFCLRKAARILKGKRELKVLQLEAKKMSVHEYVAEIFRIYNARIVEGFPLKVVHHLIDEFAALPETQEQLDHNILRPVAECRRDGKTTGILSAGCRYGIEATLKVAGYGASFDFYTADELEHSNGRMVGFGLSIYGNKRTYLLDLLNERNIAPETVAYMGDTDDDAECFDIVGYPVVPFLAPDEAKERFARKYDAFVPEDEADLLRFLRYA